MIFFPNAKINLGLYILDKRTDGYHNIQSLFYPVPLSDVVEFIAPGAQESGKKITCQCYGYPLDDASDNLCIRAYNLLKKDFPLPAVRMSLYKNIPVGSGLGGGSADGTFMLKALNEHFSLGLPEEGLSRYALRLGSDCPFFIRNSPSMVTGRGEHITPFDPVLRGVHILIAFPGIRINTGEVYADLEARRPDPSGSAASPGALILKGAGSWKDELSNQFEPFVFRRHPAIRRIKEQLYAMGAFYASLTGSGSAVYGLFREEPRSGDLTLNVKTWKGVLD
jgi:4-diphosphocytidyl-2-C-methyl-D-erythritol kinase